MLLRTLVIGGGFLAITGGLLMVQPGPPQADDPVPYQPPAASLRPPAAIPSPVQVSRAETGIDLTGTDIGSATRPVARDPLAAAVVLSAAPPAPTTSTGDDLRSLTSGVLAGLGATAPGSAVPQPDDLRALTSGVLAALNAATSGEGNAAVPQPLETLIVQALRQGQSDAYIDALLNEAASSGRIAVPSALVTSDGRVDTVTLLATLVEKSTVLPAADTTARTPVATLPGNRPAETLVYIVQPGDSLASISHRFYGDTGKYRDIFAANQDSLASPDQIRVGQKLTIPAN